MGLAFDITRRQNNLHDPLALTVFLPPPLQYSLSRILLGAGMFCRYIQWDFMTLCFDWLWFYVMVSI